MERNLPNHRNPPKPPMDKKSNGELIIIQDKIVKALKDAESMNFGYGYFTATLIMQALNIIPNER